MGVVLDTDKGSWTVFLRDASGHRATGNAQSKILAVPGEVMEEVKKKQLCFLTSFELAMKSGDHHLSHVGVDVRNGKTSYDLSDKHKNHAQPEACSSSASAGI